MFFGGEKMIVLIAIGFSIMCGVFIYQVERILNDHKTYLYYTIMAVDRALTYLRRYARV